MNPNPKSIIALAICTLAAALLSACALPPSVAVKTVLTDPAGYLSTNFKPDSVAAPVRDALAHADAGPLGFHKATLTLDWAVDTGNAATSYHTTQKLDLTNAGDSFVMDRITTLRNNVPLRQYYMLSYRGLYNFKWQSLSMAAADAGLMVVPVAVKHFDPITANATTLDYDFSLGFDNGKGGATDPFDSRSSCKIDKAYAASRLFASFTGQARNVTCTSYNANGVVSGMERYAYLDAYGLAVPVYSNSSTAHSTAKVVAATIE